MPYQTDILVDGLFAFISDLETSCIYTLLSRNSFEKRIDQLQLAIMQFKCNSLKLLKYQLPSFIDEAVKENSEFKTEIVSDLASRYENLEKNRCLHIMRRLLRHKLDESCHVLNESFHTLSHYAVQKEYEKLYKLATSIRLMEKDLGIYYEQNMTSWRYFASRYDDSAEKHDQSYGQLILRKSFMTSSHKSISVYEHKEKSWDTYATFVVETIQKSFNRQMKLGVAQLKEARNKRKPTKYMIKPPMTRSTSRIDKKKETSVEKKVDSGSAKKAEPKAYKRVYFVIDKKSEQRSDQKSRPSDKTTQSITTISTSNTIKSLKTEPEKTRRIIPIKENTSIFENILKESYETFVKYPK